MSVFWVILLSLSLSFDTFAVSVSSGIVCSHIKFRQALRFSIIMAFFQGTMPLVGWMAGSGIRGYIELFDHWIAALLLFLVAGRMFYTALTTKDTLKVNPLKLKTQLSLALATSIDALAIGFSFALLEVMVFIAAFIIGSVTFFAAMTGLLIGKKSGQRFGKPLEIAGAIILVIIGIKILVLHLS